MDPAPGMNCTRVFALIATHESSAPGPHRPRAGRIEPAPRAGLAAAAFANAARIDFQDEAFLGANAEHATEGTLGVTLSDPAAGDGQITMTEQGTGRVGLRLSVDNQALDVISGVRCVAQI